MIGRVARLLLSALRAIGAFLRDALDGSDERHAQVRGERQDPRARGGA